MRGTLLAVLFLLGVAAMSDTVADEQKDEQKKPEPLKKESYNEKVEVRRFVNGRLLTGSVKDVPAFRYEKDGVLKFYTHAKAAATPTKGSEITDEKGNVFTVERVAENASSGFHMSVVKPKPKD